MFHVKHSSPHILLINPWITDFATYNFWIKPLGLLYISSFLRAKGFRITLLDCLECQTKRKTYGDGKFHKTIIEKPEPLKSIPRNYGQYGIPEEGIIEQLLSLEKPDVVAITSGMTYWYPGVIKLIEITRKLFNQVPIILGGIYATLCYEHARRYSGADYIVSGRGELKALNLASDLVGLKNPSRQPDAESNCGEEARKKRNVWRAPENLLCDPDLDLLPYPCFELYATLDYVCILTSRGCPLHCSYCATPVVAHDFKRRNALNVLDEIQYWTAQHSVKNIAFYDDALLIDPSSHILPILREIRRRGIRCNFHAPNGLHVREIDEEVADLLFQCQFKTIRLGFETSNERLQKESGGKVSNEDFRRSVRNLRRAGYSKEDIGVYVMAGLPGQRVQEVKESIAFVKELGAKPMLVEYSPIPNTPLFEKAKKMSPFDLESEPLFHNNSIFPCQWNGFTMEDFKQVKNEIRES
jgi:radical SAM superfamily enzyme YgiQ (UPF0313 family)